MGAIRAAVVAAFYIAAASFHVVMLKRSGLVTDDLGLALCGMLWPAVGPALLGRRAALWVLERASRPKRVADALKGR